MSMKIWAVQTKANLLRLTRFVEFFFDSLKEDRIRKRAGETRGLALPRSECSAPVSAWNCRMPRIVD